MCAGNEVGKSRSLLCVLGAQPTVTCQECSRAHLQPPLTEVEPCPPSGEQPSLRRYSVPVPSIAFQTWSGPRAARLEQLTDAHSMVGGPAPGRRTRTQAINWALIVILSSELQGFFRDLHDESAEFLALRLARGNQSHFTLMRNNFTANRELDRVNPKPDTIKADFARLGIDLWADIEARVQSGVRWRHQLDRLNQARNAVAHNDPAKVAKLVAAGFPLNLHTVNAWRAACLGVARNADKVVDDQMMRTTGVRPW